MNDFLIFAQALQILKHEGFVTTEQAKTLLTDFLRKELDLNIKDPKEEKDKQKVINPVN